MGTLKKAGFLLYNNKNKTNGTIKLLEGPN
jgi:hypothetical protein